MRFQDQTFQQRERSILDAATHLFHQQPWDRLTIAEVAAHARIGKGTVYKHFPSKEALYAQLVLEFSRNNLQRLTLQAADLPAAARLRQVIRLAFAELHADPVMAQLWMHCDRPDFRQRLAPQMQQQFAALDELHQQVFMGLLTDFLHPLVLDEEQSIRLLWALEASFLGVMARIATGSFAFCEAPFRVEEYFDQISDFIIAGLQGQAAQFSPHYPLEKA
ncbi:TetR/AcrR family transcriptional regulator [Pseudomonas sp. N040]|uniref:TetR/AcrR family transcriptional regulator n=1 Tax=Pseudomonas sp. N040 TaxID=2785325 RepID=UPI0018A29945|nr:TetR/AcrR family transcriptional regulator [Pseudomonas sp. N040]MBF7730453.1 TetR/AcrR family transcriptional regulator [Pseudomonas sp. N040]MBW7014096.1 TetR/AcrR family transcriptional regulator [Pseudomonas sp. N040]